MTCLLVAVLALGGSDARGNRIVFREKITVVNTTATPIKTVVCTSSVQGESDQQVRFGPIPPNGKAMGVLSVWAGGGFTVTAIQVKDGKEVASRPFQAPPDPKGCWQPVTLTLGSIPWGSGGTLSVWKRVEWGEPSRKE